jgi:hypothetical protein
MGLLGRLWIAIAIGAAFLLGVRVGLALARKKAQADKPRPR